MPLKKSQIKKILELYPDTKNSVLFFLFKLTPNVSGL